MPNTPLPPHALAEIEADPSLQAHWDRWAAVGDAKQELADAVNALVELEHDWVKCRTVNGRVRPQCRCGQHAARYTQARETRETARAAVQEAVEAFKAGE